MEDKIDKEFSPVTSAQEVFLSKLMNSMKLLDEEFREFKIIKDNKVLNSYDMSVLIAHVLATIKFKGHFFSKRSKAYKKCYYCSDRNDLSRYWAINEKDIKLWLCKTCSLNSKDHVVPVSYNDSHEEIDKAEFYKADSFLTSSQEDLISEHREQ